MDIHFSEVGYTYLPKTPFQYVALKGVTTTIPHGKFTAIIGHTGSGKSTLIQHINALLTPQTGTIQVGSTMIKPETPIKLIKHLRKEAGLVFQFPEYQLFEETVEKDIAFGPRNFHHDESAIQELTKKALNTVGLDDSFLSRSPFELSGGQKRRVAIAGILAMEPDILILDEPTAGLDPQGAHEMMDLFKNLNKQGKTIILVTHDMDHVLKYCDHVLVMNQGQLVASGDSQTIFSNEDLLKMTHLDAPRPYQMIKLLKSKGLDIDYSNIIDVNSLAEAILLCSKKGRFHG